MKQRLLLSRKKSFWFHLTYYILLAILTFSVAEAGARVRGFRPWEPPRTDIKVEPGGRFFRSHPTLGYTPLPGTFKVTLNDSYSYHATNLDNTHRITHPLNTYPSSAKKSIWIFGDSITYGQSVDDAQTYCWLLQEWIPDYEIVNFGVMGYGTVQSLIQLQDALKNADKPELIVLAYASWQDVRNTNIRGWRKIRQPAASLGPVTQPYAQLDSGGRLEILTDVLPFREFPLMRYSAFTNALEESYDRYEERHSQSHEITKAIIKEISDLCKARRIELVVAALTSDSTTADMLEYCKREGLKTVNIWVDFLNIKENNNLPYDSHPSAIAHRQYAQKLEAFLRQHVLR